MYVCKNEPVPIIFTKIRLILIMSANLGQSLHEDLEDYRDLLP